MLKKQLEHGKVSSAGVGAAIAMPGVGVGPGVLPGVAPGIDPQQTHYRHPGHVPHQELQQQVRCGFLVRFSGAGTPRLTRSVALCVS